MPAHGKEEEQQELRHCDQNQHKTPHWSIKQYVYLTIQITDDALDTF